MNTVQTSLTKMYCNDLQAIMGVCVKLTTVLYCEIYKHYITLKEFLKCIKSHYFILKLKCQFYMQQGQHKLMRIIKSELIF